MNESQRKQDLRNAIVDLYNNLARARDICDSMLKGLENESLTLEYVTKMRKRQRIMELNYTNQAVHARINLAELTDRIIEEIIETL
jgi:hypothetical protein